MSANAPPDGVWIETDIEGRIADDVHCLECGYNLRGAAPRGTCPECGAAVRASLREDRLSEAPAAWRKTLRRGAQLFEIGVLLTLPLLYLGLTLAAVGLWLLTTPQPRREEPARDRRRRIRGRATLAVSIIGFAGLAAYFSVVLYRQPRALYGTWVAVDALTLVLHLFFLGGLFNAFDYLTALAQRMPSEPLVRQGQRLWWCWGGGLLGYVGLLLVLDAVGNSQLWASWPYWSFPAILVGMGLAILLWLWVETLMFARRLRRLLARLPAPTNGPQQSGEATRPKPASSPAKASW